MSLVECHELSAMNHEPSCLVKAAIFVDVLYYVRRLCGPGCAVWLKYPGREERDKR